MANHDSTRTQTDPEAAHDWRGRFFDEFEITELLAQIDLVALAVDGILEIHGRETDFAAGPTKAGLLHGVQELAGAGQELRDRYYSAGGQADVRGLRLRCRPDPDGLR